MLAFLGSVEDVRNCIARLTGRFLIRGDTLCAVLTTFSILKCGSVVCVCVCVCVCIYLYAYSNSCIRTDLWAFFFIYFAVGVTAIVAKVLQDLVPQAASSPKSDAGAEQPAVPEPARNPSATPVPVISGRPNLVYATPGVPAFTLQGNMLLAGYP